jgi:RNA polymerase sigma-70 factor (ECF subfamily)
MLEKREPELIAACKRGDKVAGTELLGRHYASSLGLARGILRSEEESQDAVQSAYFSALRYIRNFRGAATFKTWITRIVINESSCGFASAGGDAIGLVWMTGPGAQN